MGDVIERLDVGDCLGWTHDPVGCADIPGSSLSFHWSYKGKVEKVKKTFSVLSLCQASGGRGLRICKGDVSA
ncbi:MAG: hypothetical protein QOK48_920 [Blastocatellia bacterium]|jgi:hypothetical protein|nr:hypothetical protein [Blastocatellia bacterium]